MNKMTLETGNDTVAHDLYDLSLPLEQRAANKQRFKSAMAAANFMGVPPGKIWDKRIPGKTIFSPTQNKRYAVRIARA